MVDRDSGKILSQISAGKSDAAFALDGTFGEKRADIASVESGHVEKERNGLSARNVAVMELEVRERMAADDNMGFWVENCEVQLSGSIRHVWQQCLSNRSTDSNIEEPTRMWEDSWVEEATVDNSL